jgi:hypothetical protein
MSYLVRRTTHLLLVLTAILLALSVGYRHAVIGKHLAHGERLALLTLVEMLLTRTNVMHCKREGTG